MSLKLLVLGSGGPFANPHRASSGYVVLIDEQPRLLVDAGGGTFERLGRAEVPAALLGTVLLTHTHIDHSGGLAPVVFSAFMEGRTEPLTIVGPVGHDDQPGCRRFTELLFGEAGAWSYLHSFEGFGIEAVEVPSDPDDAVVAPVRHSEHGLTISSVAVPHGMMPAVAYRIEHEACAIVFSGDVSGEHPPLSALASGCDVLVCDMALPERETEHGHLHAKPSEVGRMARDSGCAKLVVTHVMPELEDELDEALTFVAEAYDGEIVVARDLLRVTAQ